MRHDKAENLLRLSFMMQGRADGVSLPEIMEAFAVSRRTAERMRDAVGRVYPQMEEASIGDRTKRWKIPPRSANGGLAISAAEIATVETMRSLAQRDGMGEQAKLLAGLEDKLRSLVRPEGRRRFETDLDALMAAEGLVMRPGPHPVVADGVLDDLRQAILACRTVRLHYKSRGTGAHSRQKVEPCGFLYGSRHYLVAFSRNPEVRDFRLYSLPNIARVELLDDWFTRDPEFSLAEFARASFGVWQEKPVQVVWRVSPEGAAEAREFVFHPTQTLHDQADGSLLVKFRAGGLLEMAWHLFTWGGAITVVKPKRLAKMLGDLAAQF